MNTIGNFICDQQRQDIDNLFGRSLATFETVGSETTKLCEEPKIKSEDTRGNSCCRLFCCRCSCSTPEIFCSNFRPEINLNRCERAKMKTLKEWADLINGRQYEDVLTRKEEEELKDQGFVVVFGASCESIIFCGAIDDEKNIFNDDDLDVYITPEGELFANRCEDEYCPYAYRQKIKCKKIEVVDETGVLEITSEIPNEPFIIIYTEDGVCCRGIIFDIKNVKV